MKKRSMIRKITAGFLSAALLFSVASAQALDMQAEAPKETTAYSIDELPPNTQSLLQEAEQALSVEKDDDPYTITVNHEDGSKTTTVYAVPVKYTDQDGTTEFVDTSMEPTGLLANVFQGYQYKNKANAFTAEFSNNADKGIRFSVDGSQLEMKPMWEPDTKDVESAVTASGAVERSAGKKAKAAKTAVTASMQKAADPDSEDAFVYENVFGPDTAVKYYNTNIGIKEDILLYKNIGTNRFAFEIDTNGDRPVLNPESGKIDVYDKDDPETVIYRFGNLYAYDSYTPSAMEPESTEPEESESTESMDSSQTEDSSSQLEEREELPPEVQAGQFSDEIDDTEPPFHHNNLDCYYELEELGGSKYKVTVVVPEEWLNHPDVVYPVTINPPAEAVSSATNIDDTYAAQSSPNSNYYLSDRLRFGNMNGGKVYTYLRFITMPSLSNQAVTKATLKLTLLNGVRTAHNVAAWRIDKAWEGKSLTWNNRPTNAERTQDSYEHKNLISYQIDVSSIVGRWYNNYVNYGVLINYADSTINDYNGVYSSDSGQAGKLPQLTIEHEPLESIPNGVYYIRNQYSGKYIDIKDKSTASGANIHQWQFHGGTVQQWKITAVSGRWYTIRPQNAPGMAMDVGAASPNNGANIMQYTYNGWNNQQFGFVKNANGSYRIVTRITGGAGELSVNARSTANGANIHQYTYDKLYTNDHWFLEKAGTIDSGLQEQVFWPILDGVGLTAYTMNYRFTQDYAQINSTTRKLAQRSYYVTTKTSRRPDQINTSLYANVQFEKSDGSSAFQVTWKNGDVILPSDVIHWAYKVNSDVQTISYPVTAKFSITEMESGQLPAVVINKKYALN